MGQGRWVIKMRGEIGEFKGELSDTSMLYDAYSNISRAI